MMTKGELLSQIGLSEKEARTYLAVLELGSSTVKPISDRAGVKRTSIYNFIDRLIALGLISKVKIRGRNQYRAESPARILKLQRERLSEFEKALPEFMGMFNLLGQKPRMSYFEGHEQVRNIVREEPLCKKEACYIWPGVDVIEMVGGKAFMSEIDRQRIAAGVQVKTIRFRAKDVPYLRSAHGPKFLRELRFAPDNTNITMGMGIYDTGKVGFFSSRHESFGILIESKELEQLIRSLWQLLWTRSTPARPGEG